SAVEWRAIPQRLPKRWQRGLLALPAPFIFGPSLLEIADQQPAQRSIPMRLHTIGLEAHGLLITRKRLRQLPLLLEENAQVVVRPRKVRLQAYRLPIVGHGAGELPLPVQDMAQVVVGLPKVRLESHRLLQLGPRFL